MSSRVSRYPLKGTQATRCNPEANNQIVMYQENPNFFKLWFSRFIATRHQHAYVGESQALNRQHRSRGEPPDWLYYTMSSRFKDNSPIGERVSSTNTELYVHSTNSSHKSSRWSPRIPDQMTEQYIYYVKFTSIPLKQKAVHNPLKLLEILIDITIPL